MLSLADPVPGLQQPAIPPGVTVKHNVKLNRDTTLTELWIYPSGFLLEYPHTSSSSEQAIGHLFTMQGSSWTCPSRDFAYSLGEPKGGTSNVKVYPLTDDKEEQVLCRRCYSTCQGIKACPFVNQGLSSEPHSAATRDSLKLYCKEEAQSRNSPSPDVMEKTLALYVTFRDTGCPFPVQYQTTYSAEQMEERTKIRLTPRKAKRGHHKELEGQCQRRIVCDYTKEGKLVVQCQHYSRNSRNHLVNFDVGNGLYNTEYLTALLINDTDAIHAIESAARDEGYGPLVSCKNIKNFSTQRLSCPHAHRGSDSCMTMAEMVHKHCKSKVIVYEPLLSQRAQCNQILVVCHGIHSHPPPLPTKTPSLLRTSILSFLYSFEDHLPDLTPRRLLRAPATRIYLSSQLPEVKEATFVDLHPSLGNLDHLGTYIHQAQAYRFPEGLGWKGLMHLRKVQDATLDPSLHYIRSMKEFSWPQAGSGDFEELEANMEVTRSHVFKVILCMFRQRSFDLLQAEYVQSDISHKRIAGYKEFVWMGFNRTTRNLMPYCRLFINSSSAEAHRIIFDMVREQVYADTGKLIQYRHIHSESLHHCSGILHWAMDQDGAQAKGLGLHLQQIAHSEACSKPDLHEPWQTLGDLDPYEHVNRLIRMCIAHFFRNIHKSKASETAKVKMRSLSCVNHPNIHLLIQELQAESKVTSDWIENKIQSKFAIQGLCHQESFIPLDIWKVGHATTNIIESSNRDVNREGVGCSLVGGTISGKSYSLAKLKAQENHNATGIFSSNRPGHIQQSVNRTVHRKVNGQRKSLEREDNAIIKQNNVLQKALQMYQDAVSDLEASSRRNIAPSALESKVHRRNKALQSLQTARDTSLVLWKGKKGSGNVDIILE
ncbi:hypothetical protein C8J56DRAFT_883672 [Mycena floridula]|nr:hypothetical protein C8J56DRAFT_883672 [Mycena floridula]